jgi:hypothetical protein
MTSDYYERMLRGMRNSELEALTKYAIEHLGRYAGYKSVLDHDYLQPRKESEMPFSNINIPQAGRPTEGAILKKREDRIKDLKDELASQEAALASENAMNEFKSKINSNIRLAGCIVNVLSDIKGMATGCNDTPLYRHEYAEFRTQLNAVAKDYGYKLVLVGNKTKACVVLA